jgi:hypothetical protein
MPLTFSPIPELNRLREFEERHGAFADGFQFPDRLLTRFLARACRELF